MNNKLPSYLLGKYQLVGTVTFSVLFAIIFLNIYIPFSDTAWFGLGDSVMFLLTLVFIAIAILTLIVSRIIMYKLKTMFEMTYLSYTIWCIMEITIICGFYTLATGAGASIVRAFIFIMVREVSRLTHRHTSLKHTLLTSLTVQLAISPGDVSGIGFQLSYAAMAGIAFIFPHLKELWPDDGSFNPLRKVWESAALSISCQITTGPLAYICFGTFPKYFLLSNLIALPLTGAIIPISILTVAMYTAGICPGILIRITEAAVQVMCRSLDIISGM